MKHLCFVATFLSFVLIGAPPANAQVTALTPDAALLVDGIPNEGTPVPPRHYPVSNEYRHDLLYPTINGLGGVYIGVGSDQNYTMAAAADAQLVFLVDYDPRQPLVHEIYRVLIGNAATREALVESFSDASQRASRQLLEDAFADDPRKGAILKHFRSTRSWIHRYLTRMVRAQHGGIPVAWIGDDAMYAKIKALFAAGRVIARNGDLTGTATLTAVAEACRRFNLPVRIVYTSNAEQFFPYRNSFIANMKALPTDARSVLIRTVHHPRLVNPSRVDWHYVIHSFPDFISGLESRRFRHSFGIVSELVRAGPPIAGPTGVSIIPADFGTRMATPIAPTTPPAGATASRPQAAARP